MKTGRFDGTVSDKIISENKSGNPQVVIQVDVDFGAGDIRTMNWFGQLTGGAIDHTLKALVACGIQGNELTAPITKGTKVSVVVDEDSDSEGKTRFKISWINKPMSIGTPMDQTKANATLKKFERALAALRKNEPTIKNYAADIPNYTSDEEIPF